MLARSLLRCSAPRQVVRCRQWPVRVKGRRYSTASSTASPGTQSTAGQMPVLAAFTEELDRIAPRFDIKGEQVTVLRTPEEFYETLKVRGRETSLNGWMGDADGWAGQDTKCREAYIPLDIVYRQDGARVSQYISDTTPLPCPFDRRAVDNHPPRCSPGETRIEAERPHRCPAWDTRNPLSMFSFSLSTADRRVRTREGRHPYVPYTEPDGAAQEIRAEASE